LARGLQESEERHGRAANYLFAIQFDAAVCPPWPAADDKAVDATKRARGKTNLGSVALEEFVAYVNERKISPRLTGYASENWPEKPQELYADAYALSLADPQFLNAFFPDLAAYFKKGAYRPPA
jgi:hypothetical protein